MRDDFWMGMDDPITPWQECKGAMGRCSTWKFIANAHETDVFVDIGRYQDGT